MTGRVDMSMRPPEEYNPFGADCDWDSVESREEARNRYEKFAEIDPYPDIKPALLNTGDILSYVCTTGIVWPFKPSDVRSASYPLHVGDEVIYWDDNRKRRKLSLKQNEVFSIADNSIVFVKTREFLRVPAYIALRFNLRVSNVHRGLLLGTGPIVDPGYEGNLLIPIHNLTTNTYYFRQGEAFATAEFTKLSENPLWSGYRGQRVEERWTHYEPYKPKNKDKPPDIMLTEAHAGEIRSSIPEEFSRARDESRRATYLSYASLIGVIAVVVAAFFSVSRMVMDRNDQVVAEKVENHLEELGLDRREMIPSSRVEELTQELQGLRERVDALEQGGASRGGDTNVD